MSCKELIDSLKQAADERIRQIWGDAEAQAGKMQSDTANRLEQLRQEAAAKQKAAAVDHVNRAVSDARSRARVVRLSSEKTISGRLYEAAKALLPALRSRSSERVFQSLAQELPPGPWQTVRVHPADVTLAKQFFPGAEITADERVSGGMEVSAQDGSITVVNTFEKRLERAWGDMQPELIKDSYNEVGCAASPANAPRSGLSYRIPADKDQRQALSPD